MSCQKNVTISYDEKVKGWTSFHSFYPDFMLGMNNNFFTFNGGNLYIHHSDEVDRNNFYGVSYPSKMSVIVNESPSDIKELQAISLEGNSSWDTLISAYISNVDDATYSSITSVEFVQKEGVWFAYTRRNEDVNQLDSKSAYGIGEVTALASVDDVHTIYVDGFSEIMTAGDKIFRGSDFKFIGTVQKVTRTVGNTLIHVDTREHLEINDYIIGVKNARVEGGNLRGYAIRFDLEIMKPEKVELYALNAEVAKSFP